MGAPPGTFNLLRLGAYGWVLGPAGAGRPRWASGSLIWVFFEKSAETGGPPTVGQGGPRGARGGLGGLGRSDHSNRGLTEGRPYGSAPPKRTHRPADFVLVGPRVLENEDGILGTLLNLQL